MKTDRNTIIAALRAIVAELLPRHELAGDFEYSVQSQDGAFVNLRPTDATLKLPQIPRVPFRGAPGVAGELVPGTKVIVRFVNSDPARPYVSAVIGADESGFVPTSLRVDADGDLVLGESAQLVTVGGPAAPVPPGQEVGRFVRYGDVLLPPTLTQVANAAPFTVQPHTPGANPIAPVKGG